MAVQSRTAAGDAPIAPGESTAPPTTAVLPTAVLPTQAAAPAPRCANCGASVPGRYCGECGQRLEHSAHSLWHFLLAATEDLTHADSRLWRTLAALLFKPGWLTCEFLAGRRARYLPPLRLYLVLSVLFFLFASGWRNPPVLEVHRTAQGTQLTVVPVAGDEGSPVTAAKPGETPQQYAERVCSRLRYDGPWKASLTPLFESGCRKAVADNGRSLREALLHNVPRAMFLFLPLLALAMKLMYWRPRRYYVEHLLFFVHNHAFVFLLFGLYWLVAALLPAPRISDALYRVALLYVPYYLYRSMRRVYGQRCLPTLAKLAVLSVAYLVSGGLMIGLTSAYSVLTL